MIVELFVYVDNLTIAKLGEFNSYVISFGESNKTSFIRDCLHIPKEQHASFEPTSIG